MKNEKMKRVAALALAGTIAVSTISPAAFAEEPAEDSKPIEPKVDVDEIENKDTPDTTINHVVETKPTETTETTDGVTTTTTESELIINATVNSDKEPTPPEELETFEPGDSDTVEITQDVEDTDNPSTEEVEIEVSVTTPSTDPDNPEQTTTELITDGLLHKTETTSGNTTTTEIEGTIKDEITLTPTPSDETAALGTEPTPEQQLNEEAEQVEDALSGALTNPVDTATDPDAVPDENDKVEDALEGELEEDKKEGHTPGDERTEEELQDLADAQEDVIKDQLEFPEDPEEEQKGSLTVGSNGENPGTEYGAEVETEVEQEDTTPTEEKDGCFGNKYDIPYTDIDKETTTTVTTTVTLENVTTDETGKLSVAELGKLLGLGEEFATENAELEPVVNDDGSKTYSFSWGGKNYTVTDASPDKTTTTTWVATVTSTIEEGHGNADVEDQVYVKDDLEYTHSTVEGQCGSYTDRGEKRDPSITADDVQNVLDAKLGDTVEIDGKKYTVCTLDGGPVDLTPNDYYKLVAQEDGNTVSYTIVKTPVKANGELGEIITADTLNGITDEEKLQELLGEAYTIDSETGKINYTYTDKETGEPVVKEITFEQDAIGQVVMVNITRTDTHGDVSDWKTDKEDVKDAFKDAKTEAQQNVAEQALEKLVGEVPEGTEFCNNGNGTWTAKVKDENGVEKTYTFQVESSAHVESVDKTTDSNKKEEVADAVDGKGGLQAEDIAVVATTTVKGEAYVESGKITWTQGYEGELKGDDASKNTLNQQFQSGKLTLTGTDDKPVTLNEGTTTYNDLESAPTFGGEKVQSVRVENGKIVEVITVSTTGNMDPKKRGDHTECDTPELVSQTTTKTYTFGYGGYVNGWQEGAVEDEVKDDLKDPNNGVLDNLTKVDADLTKFTWSVTTQTTTVENVEQDIDCADKIETTGDIQEKDPSLWNPDGSIYVEFDQFDKWDGTTKVDLVKDDDGEIEKKYNYQKVTVNSESLDELEETEVETLKSEVSTMLADKAAKDTEIEVTTNSDKKIVAVYTGSDGNVYTATYDAAAVTVTKEKDASVSFTGKNSQEIAQKSVIETLREVYSGNSDVRIEQFEDFLDTYEGGFENEEEKEKAYAAFATANVSRIDQSKPRTGEEAQQSGEQNNLDSQTFGLGCGILKPTTWGATLTKIQTKSGSVLTLENLKKQETVVGKEQDAGGGQQLTGHVHVAQTIQASDSKDHPAEACSARDAVYKDAGYDSYDSYKEWLTTEDHYEMTAEQYGEVVTWKETWLGFPYLSVDRDPEAGFTYQSVETEVEAVSKTIEEDREINISTTIVTPTGGSGTGTGTGEDNEGDDTPEQTVTFVMNEMPAVMTIAETETPLAAPETEETVIEDEDVALSGAPETGDELTDIGDAEVAKSDVPKTGDESGVFGLMAVLSGMALAVLSFIDRKGRHSRFGSQH